MKWWLPIIAALLASCSSLTVPGKGEAVGDSAAAHGDPMKRYREVQVAYTGEWTGVVKSLQPELVDAEYRKSSVEIYGTRRGRVVQEHRGPGGVKRVDRTRDGVTVHYDGERPVLVKAHEWWMTGLEGDGKVLK